MDFAAIGQTIYFASGIIASVIGGYGYMKTQNKALYPIEKIEAGKAKIEALVEGNKALAEGNKAYQEVKGNVGNISNEELNNIFNTARGYADKGSMSVAEAQKLGVMVLEAVETKE